MVETQTALVDSLGGNAKVNADGTITGPTYNVAQGTQTNVGDADRKSTRLNSSHMSESRMPSSA